MKVMNFSLFFVFNSKILKGIVPAMNTFKNRIKIAALCGSLRKGSYTLEALKLALSGAEEMNVETLLIDLNDYQLGFCDGRKDHSTYSKGTQLLLNEIKTSQGIIIGTPEYHGSFSGVLKNALDFMSFNEFEGKMIGLIGVSGGSMGAASAINSLRFIGRALHAWVIPHQVIIPNAWKYFDANGKLNDSELSEKIKLVGKEVAKFSILHNSEQALEFLKEWEKAPMNPGAD